MRYFYHPMPSDLLPLYHYSRHNHSLQKYKVKEPLLYVKSEMAMLPEITFHIQLLYNNAIYFSADGIVAFKNLFQPCNRRFQVSGKTIDSSCGNFYLLLCFFPVAKINGFQELKYLFTVSNPITLPIFIVTMPL
jgi:hypothetical protein